MHCKSILVIVVALMVVSVVTAEESKVEAEVKSVIVYPDRAKVTRVAELNLDAGSHSVIVENLPGGAVDGSIRASAFGVEGITLLGLSHSSQEHRETPNQKVAELEKELERLHQDEKQVVADRLATFEQLKKFVGSLSDGAAKEMTREVAEGGLDVSQWGAAYAFVSEKNFSLNDSIRLAQQELKEINSRIGAVRNEVRKLSTTHRRTTKTVQVDLELARAGDVELTIEYVTPGAEWKPLYDARIGDDPDRVQFTYFAEVSQKTGEDWSDVELTLSTARPSLGAGPGELTPWFLAGGYQYRARSSIGSTGQIKGRVIQRDNGQPVIGASVLLVGTTQGAMTDLQGRFQILRVDPGIYTLRLSHLELVTVEVTDVEVMADAMTDLSQQMTPKVTDLDQTIRVCASQDIQDKFMVDSRVTLKQLPVQTVDNLLAQVAGIQTSAAGESRVRGGRAGEVAYFVPGMVSSGAYPTVFKIKRKESMLSGDEAVRVTVAEWQFDGETKLIARPRNRSGAFRLVTVNNQDAAPLMPGPVAIFAGTHFLGHTQFMQLIAPGEEFDLAFGLDNHVTVEREVLSFKKTRKGDKVQIDQTIQITIHNYGDVARTLELEETIPVTRDSRIKVKLGKILPEPLTKDERGNLAWTIELMPDAETVVTVPYRVTHPAGLPIAGL